MGMNKFFNIIFEEIWFTPTANIEFRSIAVETNLADFFGRIESLF